MDRKFGEIKENAFVNTKDTHEYLLYEGLDFDEYFSSVDFSKVFLVDNNVVFKRTYRCNSITIQYKVEKYDEASFLTELIFTNERLLDM